MIYCPPLIVNNIHKETLKSLKQRSYYRSTCIRSSCFNAESLQLKKKEQRQYLHLQSFTGDGKIVRAMNCFIQNSRDDRLTLRWRSVQARQCFERRKETYVHFLFLWRSFCVCFSLQTKCVFVKTYQTLSCAERTCWTYFLNEGLALKLLVLDWFGQCENEWHPLKAGGAGQQWCIVHPLSVCYGWTLLSGLNSEARLEVL